MAPMSQMMLFMTMFSRQGVDAMPTAPVGVRSLVG